MSLAHKKSDDLAKHCCEDRDKDRQAAGRWNAPLRINSVLWTNGASCNPYLWILSNLSQQTPLSVTLPTTFSVDRSHLFLPSLSIREKQLAGAGTLTGAPCWWPGYLAGTGAITRYGLSVLFCFTEQWFPLAPVILNYTFWRAGMCLVLVLSCLQRGHRKQGHVPAGHWYPFLLWKLTFGTWNTC